MLVCVRCGPSIPSSTQRAARSQIKNKQKQSNLEQTVPQYSGNQSKSKHHPTANMGSTLKTNASYIRAHISTKSRSKRPKEIQKIKEIQTWLKQTTRQRRGNPKNQKQTKTCSNYTVSKAPTHIRHPWRSCCMCCMFLMICLMSSALEHCLQQQRWDFFFDFLESCDSGLWVMCECCVCV